MTTQEAEGILNQDVKFESPLPGFRERLGFVDADEPGAHGLVQHELYHAGQIAILKKAQTGE